jgi:hypothetical protein
MIGLIEIVTRELKHLTAVQTGSPSTNWDGFVRVLTE